MIFSCIFMYSFSSFLVFLFFFFVMVALGYRERENFNFDKLSIVEFFVRLFKRFFLEVKLFLCHFIQLH